MWLVGVVVRRYIDILIIIINFPYSTCIRSFFGSSILTSLFIFKMFFRSLYNNSQTGKNFYVLYMYILCIESVNSIHMECNNIQGHFVSFFNIQTKLITGIIKKCKLILHCI